MSGAGFDWLNILAADSSAPPPPVSFGLTPSSSSASLALPVSQLGSLNNSRNDLAKREAVETNEDVSIPLSLRADQLTAEEAKTYLRWYNDIVVRRGTNVIRLEDVFAFLRNFRIPDETREILGKIFREVNSLNVGEFFALLRVIAHTILGQKPLRRLIQKPAPIPKPKSILSAKRVQEPEDDEEPKETTLDLDSFTQMLMTGETPRKKKMGQKRIKFSDQVSIEPTIPKHVEPVKIDLSLPMDQLMKNMPKKHQEPINEEEELKDIQVDRFQNIKNVDSALIHGTPSNIPSIFFDEVVSATSSPSLEQPTPLAPNHTGPVRLLSPNHTGPVPMTNGLQPSMTTDYFSPQNYHIDASHSLQLAKTGSFSSSVRQPSPLYQSSSPMHNTPPAPPERRLRYSSSPQPVDHQVTLEQLAQATLPNNNLTPAPPPPRITSPNRQASPMTPAPPPPRRRCSSQPPLPPPNIRSVSSPLTAQQNSYPHQNVFSQQNGDQQRPPLPPKIARNNTTDSHDPYPMYQQQNRSGSTGDILNDLKRLQNEVDRLSLRRD